MIVAAIDRSADAKRIVEEAESLARAFDEELHVVHVAGQYESTNRARLTAAERPGEEIDIDEFARRATDRAREAAEGVAERFTPIGLVGYPAEEILDYAEDHDARYVVVGGRKRSPVGKVLFGSVTQAVLLGADRPVVTVRVGDREGEGAGRNH